LPLPLAAHAAVTPDLRFRRDLATREPDRHTPDLAHSLTGLAQTLMELGRRDDALACHGEATARWADLAHRRPDDLTDGYDNQLAQLARRTTPRPRSTRRGLKIFIHRS
jgi:hypothetical protein